MQPDANIPTTQAIQVPGIDITPLFDAIGRGIQNFFGFGDPFSNATTYHDVLMFLGTLWNIYAIGALVVSAFFVYGWIYAFLGTKRMSAASIDAIHTEEQKWQEEYGAGAKHTRSRIDDIKEHITSQNPNDWRIAIVEADIVLEEILENMGIPGTTIGEQLKSTKFATIQDAWEAHKVRNKIAHEGAGFELTQKIANDTIARYERVFNEFGV